ncbi:hypothetical protein [Streptomyces luteoverticillatus]|uniref:hypothetical protein n=1 Tax=Streptomyces luteoverticillatus TaxID=66425 RepID=UPI0013DEF7A6|nr:hypothetical protein [Streptomyces luteoverticillatus]
MRWTTPGDFIPQCPRLPQVSESLITWASITLMTRRLTRKPARKTTPQPAGFASMPAAA